MPLMTVYGEAKAFVYSFAHPLVNQLKRTDVTVTALMPNATATDFYRKAGAADRVATD